MLRLRPYKACDANQIVTWIKDEYSFHQWCADRFHVYPITAQMMNQHYDGMASDDSCWQMTAFDETGVVGHFTMRFTSHKKNIIRLGFVILSDRARGRGLGKEMLRLALNYSFYTLKVDKVTLGVFANNPSAYFCYKAVGFQDVASNGEAYLIQGEVWKCIEMEVSLKSYQAGRRGRNR